VISFFHFQTDKDWWRNTCFLFLSRFPFHSLHWVIASGDHNLGPMASLGTYPQGANTIIPPPIPFIDSRGLVAGVLRARHHGSLLGATEQ
jgi:hypothetical protein